MFIKRLFGGRLQFTGRFGATGMCSAKLRPLVMLMLPVGIMWLVAGLIGPLPPAVAAPGAAVPGVPNLAPPSNLQLVTLDSSFHVTWTPSPDPQTVWHVVSVWEGATLHQAKVVGRTARAAQTNGLTPGGTYTVKVQAMDAQGNLSAAVQATAATDPQYPMRNAAFFENFNGGSHGELDYNYFDVRTTDFVGNVSDLVETRMVFNNEKHYHTQLINGPGTGGLYIRSRVPFDFTGRTGTLQFEVDFAPTQHSHGKWFAAHLVREDSIPSNHNEFGDANGREWPDSVEFAMYESDDDREGEGHNLPLITVNIGGTVHEFKSNTPFITPANVRVPVVLKVSQTSAEMLVNGVSVLRASGFSLPFTRGYWLMTHKNYNSEKVDGNPDFAAPWPTILQLAHWDMWQFDGPPGSINPVVRTFIQPGCGGTVHLGHNRLIGCDPFIDENRRTNSMTFNIGSDVDVTRARSAKLLFNGSSDRPLQVNINGHTAQVPVNYDDTIMYALTVYDFPVSWLRQGQNTLTVSTDDTSFWGLAQFEIEVVFNQPRVMQNTPAMPMPMLGVTGNNFRVDHIVGDPQVHTLTTYLYSAGSAQPVSYNVQVISDTPWLTVSPASGTVQSPVAGGRLQQLTLTVNVAAMQGEEEVGVVKITGGGMPVYIGVLAIDKDSTERPYFVQSYAMTTTFNKSAIPDYYGGRATPTPMPTAARTPTPVPMPSTTVPPPLFTPPPVPTPPTHCIIRFNDVPPDHWAAGYIQYLACNGIVGGYNDGSFRPGASTTRGQLAKMLVLGQGWPVDTSGGPHFTDVPPSHTFYGYVETAYNRRVIGGYGDGTFRPGSPVTRGQLAKMIVLAKNWPVNTSGGPHFADVPQSHTFYGYVETVYNHGVVGGYEDGTFRPGNTASRAQISKMLYNALAQP